MNKTAIFPNNGGLRGPQEHNKRDEIIKAARACFSHYGYSKTTVSDLAREIGISKAYIYKFFESKQAIGEAICASTLKTIGDAIEAKVTGRQLATDKIGALGETMVAASMKLWFADRKLYDVAAHSAAERWRSWLDYQERIEALLIKILDEGRANGEIAGEPSVQELASAILITMQPFMHPLFLQYNLETAAEGMSRVIGLVQRSLRR